MNDSEDFRGSRSIPRILDIDCQKRFKMLLQQQFHVTEVANKGETVIFHYKVEDESEIKVDIILYTTGNLCLSSSPKIEKRTFTLLENIIYNMAVQCIETLSETRPMTYLRATSILEFALNLDSAVDHNRMVLVILCDTANEILLTELLLKSKIKGPPLDESISEKIKRLEKKGIVIPIKDHILSIRNLRNDVVHKGVIPDINQRDAVAEKTQKFIETM